MAVKALKHEGKAGIGPYQSYGIEDINSEHEDDPILDIGEKLAVLWRGKWIVAICILLASVFGFLTISQLEPRYMASAKVLFDLQNRQIANVDSLIVGAGVNERTLQNEIEILSSTQLIDNVVEALKLDQNPEFNPFLNPSQPTQLDKLGETFSIPPEIFDIAINLGIVAPPAPPPDAAELEIQAEARAERQRLLIHRKILKGLDLLPISGSKVIQISYVSRNRNTSAAIANAIAEHYITGQLDAKLEATKAATEWLSGRVEELRVRVQVSEEAVEIARAEQSVEAGQSLEITQQQLLALNASLSVTKSQASVAKATYERLSLAISEDRDLGAIPEFRNSSLYQRYRDQEAALIGEQIVLEATFRENHPSRIRVAGLLANVRATIDKEISRVVEAARSTLVAQQEQVKIIEQGVRELDTKALEQSRNQVTIRQLEREAQASRILYENFLARLEETSLQNDLQVADARILSRAEPPLFALQEAKQRGFLISLLLGGVIGVGIVFLLDKLNNTFRAPNQIEVLTGETVLGVVPAVGRRLHRQDVVRNFRNNPKSSLAESIRSLRTSILFSNVDNPPSVVMFTSSIPREAKSTTSMLVAMTSQQMGKSAIIVDCDLRLPSLARLLDADDGKPGLLSTIEGTAELEEAIFLDPETGLHVLMTKPSEPRSNLNAADIFVVSAVRRYHCYFKKPIRPRYSGYAPDVGRR